MKKLILITVLLSCFYLKAQDYERVYVEAGLFKPLGKLSDKFEASPSFGFWFRTKLVQEDFVDLGFNFFIPKNPIAPEFRYRNSIVNYKSDHFAINIGSRFARKISLSQVTTNFNVEWNAGIGVALNFYSAPDDLEFAEGEHTREVLTTFYLSQGLKLNYKNVGLQCHYQWSPYGLFNGRIDNFGSRSIMFGIVYRQ